MNNLKPNEQTAFSGANEKPASGSAEQRGEPRLHPPILSALVEARNDRQIVTVFDLSRTGARIINAPPGLEVGDSLRLAALLHGYDTFTAPCTVVHLKGNEAHSEAGVRFGDLTADESRALAAYLRERQAIEFEAGVEMEIESAA